MTVRVNFHFGHLDRMDKCIHGRVEGFCGTCWPASVDGRRMAETAKTGSVPQGTTSAVANGETPTPSSAQPGDA